jgi:hypothetical protein
MSSDSISRTECASATSLADLLATLKAGNLPERKRQELASAIRTAARALGRSPEIIPADGRLLASRLKEVAPAAIGISRGRWNNVRALLRTALALVQPISPGRHRNDLLPERSVSRPLYGGGCGTGLVHLHGASGLELTPRARAAEPQLSGRRLRDAGAALCFRGAPGFPNRRRRHGGVGRSAGGNSPPGSSTQRNGTPN